MLQLKAVCLTTYFRRNFSLFALLLLIPLIFTLTACNNDTTSEPDLEFVGNLIIKDISDVPTGQTVPVYKTKGVTDVEALAMLNIVQNDVLDTLTFTHRTNFKNNVTAVHVVPAGSGITHSGKVISIGADETDPTIGPYLTVNGFFAMIELKDAHRLAGHAEVPGTEFV